MTKKKWTRLDAAFLCVLLAMAGVFLYRIAAGFPSSDEAFYLTVPLRLAQGDSLLADEWHVTQLAGAILYPLLQLYLWIARGTEGIVLAFRYFYLAAQMTTVTLGWLLLRRISGKSGLVASIMFGLFVPVYVVALSYNTMGLMAVWLLALLEMSELKYFRFKHVAMGVLLALSVLCNPYILALYGVYLIIALLRSGRRSGFAWMTAGAGMVLAAFLALLFSRTSLNEILGNLPYVLSDASHQSKGLYALLRPMIVYCQFYWPYVAVTVVLFAVGLFAKKQRRLIFAIASVVAVIAACSFCVIERPYIGVNYNAVLTPMVPLGLMAFVFGAKRNYRLLGAWLIGVFYTLCMIISSNVGLSSMQSALTIPAALSALMIGDYLKENEHRSMKTGCAVLAVVWLTALVFSNVNGIFNDGKPWTLTATIEAGPYKGTRTTEGQNAAYEAEYGNVLSMGDCAGKNLVFYSVYPCGYLVHSEANNAALSAWLDGPIKTLDDSNMSAYYVLHPEKIPDMIYVDSASATVWDAAQWQAYGDENGYAMTRFENGALLLKREE